MKHSTRIIALVLVAVMVVAFMASMVLPYVG